MPYGGFKLYIYIYTFDNKKNGGWSVEQKYSGKYAYGLYLIITEKTKNK